MPAGSLSPSLWKSGTNALGNVPRCGQGPCAGWSATWRCPIPVYTAWAWKSEMLEGHVSPMPGCRSNPPPQWDGNPPRFPGGGEWSPPRPPAPGIGVPAACCIGHLISAARLSATAAWRGERGGGGHGTWPQGPGVSVIFSQRLEGPREGCTRVNTGNGNEKSRAHCPPDTRVEERHFSFDVFLRLLF